MTPAPCPGWLVDLLVPKPRPTEPVRRASGGTDDQRLLARFNGLLDVMADAQEPIYRGGVKIRNGNRNERLFWAATRLRDLEEEGASPAWEELLVRAGMARGMSEVEARKTVQSGLKAPRR